MVVAYFELVGGGSGGVRTFFRSVTQAVLLFEVETKVLTPRMEQALSNFQHRVVLRLIRRHLRIQEGGIWE